MVINELLKKGVALIQGKQYINPVLESILVLSRILEVDKSYIWAHGDEGVSDQTRDRFLEIMNMRKEDIPLEYIFNQREFYGIDFYVEEGVLIPRPETELLVDYVIEYVNKKYRDQSIKILEIGIGSGAISLSLGKILDKARVYGVDIEDVPLRVSGKNLQDLNLNNVEFFKSDLFENVRSRGLKDFQVILSNPPYIESGEISKLQKQVKNYEPATALDGGADGLDFYRRISKEAMFYLNRGGLLIYEIGYKQGPKVKSILEDLGYENIEVLKDYQGHDRIVVCFNR